MALDGSVLYLSHFQFLFTMEGKLRCVMVPAGSHGFDVFLSFFFFTNLLKALHSSLGFKIEWTFKAIAVSIRQEFSQTCLPTDG